MHLPLRRSSPPRSTPASARLRVAHVITDLDCGGAETMLYKIVAATQAYGLTHSIASLIDGGVFASRLTSDGVSVTSMGMHPGKPDLRAVPRLIHWLRRERPDVVQSWMYHADLLAGMAALAAGRVPVVWGIRQADVDPRTAKTFTRWTRSTCARLSGVLADRVVCCAESARRSHAAIGYRADRMIVIPNGFDLAKFVRDASAGARIRHELSIPDEGPVVGLLARFHPDKDHANFLAAARLIARASPRATFVLAGDGVEWSNAALVSQIGDLRNIRLLGRRSDVTSLLSCMDVMALSSRSEAFPNVLGEAMSCGVPCVATDCGDSREIIGATGRVVPPRDPAALADGILELLALAPSERAAMGIAATARVRERYDIRVVARQYADLYREVSHRGVREIAPGVISLAGERPRDEG
jgi:glycosyltransferase involved in cell wall biosynthesis